MEESRVRHWRFKRYWVWAAVTLLVLTALGVGANLVIENAYGAGPTSAKPACDASMGCSVRHNRRVFKRHKIGHSHGAGSFKHRLYRNPRAVKRVWVHKISRKMGTANSRLIRQGYAPRYSASSAQQAYHRLFVGEHVSVCMGGGNYPAWATGPKGCNMEPPSSVDPLTKHQVQVLGTVTLCGGGAVAAGLLAPESAGGSVWVMSFLGASSCGWNLWRDIDPD